MKDCISKNLQGDINEFLGSRVLTGVTGFNLHTKDHVTFQLKFYFLKMKSLSGNMESTSECFSGNSSAYCSFCWR